MSALAFDFDLAPVAPPRRRLYAVRGTVDARPVAARTLDTALGSAWEALSGGRQATCPVCSAAMRPGPAGGTCSGCGSSLS